VALVANGRVGIAPRVRVVAPVLVRGLVAPKGERVLPVVRVVDRDVPIDAETADAARDTGEGREVGEHEFGEVELVAIWPEVAANLVAADSVGRELGVGGVRPGSGALSIDGIM